jgi:hypothetical protein
MVGPLPVRELVQSVERRGLVELGQGRVVEDGVDEMLHRPLEDQQTEPTVVAP